MSRDGYGSDSDDSDSDDSETGGGGWDKSEVKRKRIMDQFIESEFRKRRKVRNSILHYYIPVRNSILHYYIPMAIYLGFQCNGRNGTTRFACHSPVHGVLNLYFVMIRSRLSAERGSKCEEGSQTNCQSM